MTQQYEITIESLMEQAQVYASAWSLVGGVFDNGDQLEVAKVEKEVLKDMLEAFRNESAGNLKEIAEGLVAWHTTRITNIKTILDAPEDTEIRLGSGADPVVLTGNHAVAFRAGLSVCLEWFGKFPLSIQRTEPSDEEE